MFWPTFLPQNVSVYLQLLLRNLPRKLPKSVKLRSRLAYYAVQSHPVWYQSKAHVLLVFNTNLPPILHRFQVMADYWSNFR